MCDVDHSRPTATRSVAVISFISSLYFLIVATTSWGSLSGAAIYIYITYAAHLINLILSLLLMYATLEKESKGSLSILRFWIGYTLIGIVFLIIAMVLLPFQSKNYCCGEMLWVALTYGIALMVGLYFIYIVSSHYQARLQENNESAEKTEDQNHVSANP